MNRPFKTCLLVEDDPDDRDFFVNTLHAVSSGAGCFAASNGSEALYWLLEKRVTPDFIFTDLQMPRMNGFEFIESVKAFKELRDIPVIVYSSSYSEEHCSKIKALGAAAFYSKLKWRDLRNILRKCLSDGD